MLGSLAYCQSCKGHDISKHKSSIWTHHQAFPQICRSSISRLCSYNKQGAPQSPSHSFSYQTCHGNSGSDMFYSTTFISLTLSGRKGLYFSRYKQLHWERFRANVAYDVAGAIEVMNDLGLDTLTFLAVTVLVVPTFKLMKASPILGFFFAGVVLNQFGLIRNITDVKVLSEWGILFLLFEMGLELSLARLKALAKYAFGMGLAQVLLSTLAFTSFELPPNGAIGTKILEFLFHSRPDLVNIRSVDEAVVIGAALSLSSSAFVLQVELEVVLNHAHV